MSPPVLGFNNNVRHRGRVFHIQTEDSGVKAPRIVTHLFADGGRIIKTARSEYKELLGRSDVQQLVRQMMKEQHKAMFSALRKGELDALLEASCGPLPLPPDPEKHSLPVTESRHSALSLDGTASLAPVTQPRSSIGLGNPNLHKVAPSVPPPSREAIDQAVRALGVTETSVAPPSRKSRPAPAASGRPSSRGGPPAPRSLFGEGVISEKSLDEVILSYLAEDLDGSNE